MPSQVTTRTSQHAESPALRRIADNSSSTGTRLIARATSAQSISNGPAWTTVGFTEELDTSDAFSPNTFTCPASGYYLINCKITWGVIPGDVQLYAMLDLSSHNDSYSTEVQASGDNHPDTDLNALVYMDADETLAVKVRHSYGSAISLLSGDYVWLTITSVEQATSSLSDLNQRWQAWNCL